MMVDIKHDSEESLIDFDVIESNIREQEREIEREVAENAASKKVNMTVDDEYDQFMDEFDDHMHDEMGAYWKESSGELPEDSDDEFVSGWYTKGPTKKRITKARPAYTIKNRDHRDSNTSNDQIMLQIRREALV